MLDIQAALKYAQQQGADYADIRYEEENTRNLVMENKDINKFLEATTTGYFVRVLCNGNWGLASTSNNDQPSLHQAIKNAISLAQKVPSKNPTQLNETETIKATEHWQPKINPRNLDVSEAQQLLTDLHNQLTDYNEISKTQSRYSDELLTKHYANTDGTKINWSMPRTVARMQYSAKNMNDFNTGFLSFGGVQGFELFQQDPLAKARKDAEATIKALGAPMVKGGQQQVILDPHLTGVFVHEAVGHASEADLVAAGESCFAGKLGQQLGIEELTIRDDARIPGAFGSVPFDDDGAKTGNKILMQNGVLTNYLADRQYAAKYNLETSGSARAQDATYRPLVRMTNTLIEPGTWTHDDMLADIKHGYFCAGSRGGQVDVGRGDFMFNSTETYEIINGEIGRPMKAASLTGNTLTTLKNISALGNKQELSGPGYCGKGQSIPVSDGGPWTRIDNCLIN